MLGDEWERTPGTRLRYECAFEPSRVSIWRSEHIPLVFALLLFVYVVMPDQDLEIREVEGGEGGHLDLEIRGTRSPKLFFRPFGSQLV